jgi:hypothetical protein
MVREMRGINGKGQENYEEYIFILFFFFHDNI